MSSALIVSPACSAAIKASPSAWLIIIDGIVTLPPSAPAPIVIGPPATLLTIITAIAPAFSAARILKPNSQVPLLITAIFPSNSEGLIIVWHASWGSGASSPNSPWSFNKANSPESGVSSGNDSPNPAGSPVYSPAKLPFKIVRGSPAGPLQRNIVICGFCPSGGVPKLALLKPLPSWPSAFTLSLPNPPFP